MTLAELYLKIQSLANDPRALNSRVLVDTEARTFNSHMIPLEDLTWSRDDCDAIGLGDFTVIHIDLKGAPATLKLDLARSEAKREKLREALKFYAKVETWEWTTSEFTFDGCGCSDFDTIKPSIGEPPVQVGGKKARAAIAADKEGE